jgi:hypothetical protein
MPSEKGRKTALVDRTSADGNRAAIHVLWNGIGRKRSKSYHLREKGRGDRNKLNATRPRSNTVTRVQSQ